MVNYTRKKKFGGNLNIFSKYEPEEIRNKLDNYLAAAYALQQSAQDLNETIKIKYDTKNLQSSTMMDKKNSEMFFNATKKLNDLITSLKTNIR
jgi:hypothetical protein